MRAGRHNFREATERSAGDRRLRLAIQEVVVGHDAARKKAMGALPDAEGLRRLAGEIRQHTLDHLDFYIEQFERNVRARGGVVHLARDAAEAKRVVLSIARSAKVCRVIKSRSLAAEEVDLTSAMRARGLEVSESDPADLILNLCKDRASHLVAPVVHRDRAEIAKVLAEHLGGGTPSTADPGELNRLARDHLRQKARAAEMAITGASFLVAETGQVCVAEKEGSARRGAMTPGVLVCVAGIEKLVPRLGDLAVMLKLLTRSATGQAMTAYTSLFGGVRKDGERDGPSKFHVVLLDNGRSDLLAGEHREALRCIRCAACLNACPVYREIGGHAYGSIYPGPIGALITPVVNGLGRFADLPRASSLCGACFEACPVRIDIPRHLVILRKEIAEREISNPFERLAYRAWGWAMGSESTYRLLVRLQRRFLARRADGEGWVWNMPWPLRGWTDVRPVQKPAEKSFSEMWRDRR